MIRTMSDAVASDDPKQKPPAPAVRHSVPASLARFFVGRLNRSLLCRFRATAGGVRWSRGEIGALGEDLAVKWLRRHGRKVLHRNYRGPHRGEVDIVCRHKDVLNFIEVKTRSSTAFGRPADAVGPAKQRLIRRGAMDWLRKLKNPKIKFRFDIVEVLLVHGARPKINIIENAFQMPDSSIAGR